MEGASLFDPYPHRRLYAFHRTPKGSLGADLATEMEKGSGLAVLNHVCFGVLNHPASSAT